jgi:hypothetical protein
MDLLGAQKNPGRQGGIGCTRWMGVCKAGLLRVGRLETPLPASYHQGVASYSLGVPEDVWQHPDERCLARSNSRSARHGADLPLLDAGNCALRCMRG